MKYRAAILAFIFLSVLITVSCDKEEELAPAEPTPGEVLSEPGENKAESREELIEKREYQEEMKERAKNNENL